jgi:hypothetical protein
MRERHEPSDLKLLAMGGRGKEGRVERGGK